MAGAKRAGRRNSPDARCHRFGADGAFRYSIEPVAPPCGAWRYTRPAGIVETQLQLEALGAVVLSPYLASAFLLLPQEETDIAVLGDVSRITVSTTLVTVVIAAGIFLTVKRSYPTMVLIGLGFGKK